MDHHTTWLTLLPFYGHLEAWVRGFQAKGMLGQPVVVQHVLAAFLVALVLWSMGWQVRRAIARAGVGAVVPGPQLSVRNILEVVAEAMLKQMHTIIGSDAPRYFPTLFVLTLFVFTSNALGLIPGFLPPTDNWNTTCACGLFVFLYYNGHGLRVMGFGHFAHMANPTGLWWGWFLAPLMLPIELISHLARPATLGVRLATNMIADHAVLLAFLGLAPLIVPIPFMALGLFVCIVQTLVFVLLSMVYIGLAVAHEGHDDAHDDHGQKQHPEPHAPSTPLA